MRPKGRITIRVDANAEIGSGHLSRCTTLGRQLQRDGFAVSIASRPGYHAEACAPIPVSWIDIAASAEGEANTLADSAATLSIAGTAAPGPSCVIVDHYALDAAWESAIRDQGHAVMAIDDFRDRRHCADLLVSDSDLPFDRLLNPCVAHCTELRGARYAIVDSSFVAPSSLDRREAPWSLLVTYGASDPTGETLRAIAAIASLQRTSTHAALLHEIHVVIGPSNARGEAIELAVAGLRGGIVHRAPRTLAPVMRDCDLVLTSGGHTLLEALASERPCLVTQTAANQALSIARLRGLDAVVFAGASTGGEAQTLEEGLSEMLASLPRRIAAARTHRMFDGHGASRISAAIQRLMAERQIPPA